MLRLDAKELKTNLGKDKAKTIRSWHVERICKTAQNSIKTRLCGPDALKFEYDNTKLLPT